MSLARGRGRISASRLAVCLCACHFHICDAISMTKLFPLQQIQDTRVSNRISIIHPFGKIPIRYQEAEMTMNIMTTRTTIAYMWLLAAFLFGSAPASTAFGPASRTRLSNHHHHQRSTTTTTTSSARHDRAAPVASHLQLSSSSQQQQQNEASSNNAVTVLGGTGFVGSRVCQLLAEQGASVTSLSQSGRIPEWCADADWTQKVDWQAIDLKTATPEKLDAAMGKPVGVVSCVGVVGTSEEVLKAGNGAANVAAFESAKRAGSVKRVAYVSVSSEVAACQENWLPDFFAGYFEGKMEAEEAAKAVCDSVTIVRPTFIYGGDSFGLFPPRVNKAYGAFIDQLLSVSLFQKLADVSPGLIKVALRPPVPVEAVAGACVAGVLNEKDSGVVILDSAAAINEAANQPPSTGVEDALRWFIETVSAAGEWMSSKLKEQAMKP